mmetsp:Transcript_14020/g.31942  ORF Transcript_14020/g.31942 Transcript_14020/m.31942 type:complete len:206 (-) Transcript_14020:108-725(-)
MMSLHLLRVRSLAIRTRSCSRHRLRSSSLRRSKPLPSDARTAPPELKDSLACFSPSVLLKPVTTAGTHSSGDPLFVERNTSISWPTASGPNAAPPSSSVTQASQLSRFGYHLNFQSCFATMSFFCGRMDMPSCRTLKPTPPHLRSAPVERPRRFTFGFAAEVVSSASTATASVARMRTRLRTLAAGKETRSTNFSGSQLGSGDHA